MERFVRIVYSIISTIRLLIHLFYFIQIILFYFHIFETNYNVELIKMDWFENGHIALFVFKGINLFIMITCVLFFVFVTKYLLLIMLHTLHVRKISWSRISGSIIPSFVLNVKNTNFAVNKKWLFWKSWIYLIAWHVVVWGTVLVNTRL